MPPRWVINSNAGFFCGELCAVDKPADVLGDGDGACVVWLLKFICSYSAAQVLHLTAMHRAVFCWGWRGKCFPVRAAPTRRRSWAEPTLAYLAGPALDTLSSERSGLGRGRPTRAHRVVALIAALPFGERRRDGLRQGFTIPVVPVEPWDRLGPIARPSGHARPL